VFGCLLQRMIFWELVKVFALCLVGITGIILMAGIVAEASQQGLGPGQILAIIPLLIPSTLPYTIPATTLFATCVVYGRLSADNEILAIRASGINLLKVVRPALVIGLLTSAGTMTLYYRIIPYTHGLMRSMFIGDVEELLYSLLKKNRQIMYNGFDYAIFVKGVQGRRLINPTFKHYDAHGEVDAVAQADEAELHVDINRQILLVRMFRGSAWARGGALALFQQRDWSVPLPKIFDDERYRRARDMTWDEIHQRRFELQKEEVQIRAQAEQAQALARKPNAPEYLPMHITNLGRKARMARSQILQLDAELQMRPALSLGCLFFVLVGCPVGIWFSRNDYLSSFITCFLPIVFLYYPLVLCGTDMAKDGKFDPVVTVWAADAVMGVIGLGLFVRLLRH
jgi:lipopolysaccharide export system permease protein